MRVTLGVVLVLALFAVATLATGRWQDLWQGFGAAGLRTGGSAASGPAGSAELPGHAALGPPVVGPPGPDQDEARRAASDGGPDGGSRAGEGPATLRLVCEPSGAGLSATLTVPPLAAPAPAADAGPAGSALPTGIMVSGPGGVRSVRVSAAGAADPARGVALTVAGARRDEDPLRGVATGMTQPGARITWSQDGSRRNDPTLTATFSVSDADAAALKAGLGGCLPR